VDIVPVAAMIDVRLADGSGKGWRFDVMPADRDAYALGLRGIDEHAHATYGAAFRSLPTVHQDEVLLDVQRATVRGAAWQRVPAARFFVELLAEVTECYYSHPLAQESIGYVGMADRPGWTAVGLDRLEAREPRPFAAST